MVERDTPAAASRLTEISPLARTIDGAESFDALREACQRFTPSPGPPTPKCKVIDGTTSFQAARVPKSRDLPAAVGASGEGALTSRGPVGETPGQTAMRFGAEGGFNRPIPHLADRSGGSRLRCGFPWRVRWGRRSRRWRSHDDVRGRGVRRRRPRLCKCPVSRSVTVR